MRLHNRGLLGEPHRNLIRQLVINSVVEGYARQPLSWQSPSRARLETVNRLRKAYKPMETTVQPPKMFGSFRAPRVSRPVFTDSELRTIGELNKFGIGLAGFTSQGGKVLAVHSLKLSDSQTRAALDYLLKTSRRKGK